LNTVKATIKQAIDEAVSRLRSCSLSVTTTRLEAHSLQRRIPTEAGIIMSDSIQPIAPALLLREPVDRRVHILALHDMQGIAISTIVHAICHPVHEMCMPHISPDYPGELCMSLEAAGTYGMPLFLNGAAGDTNPPTVSEGPAFAHAHGKALAELVQNNTASLVVDASALRLAHGAYQVNVRSGVHISNEKDALARLNVLCIGPLALVFLPGEFFIELAYDIERDSPFEHTIVVGYAENNIGYVPTLAAFEEGGYEAGPGKWSFLEKEAGPKLCKEALRLLNKLYQKEVANINLI
jgi:neutral ceramidase